MKPFIVFLFIFTVLFLSGCSTVEVSKADGIPNPNTALVKKDLSQINLSAIKHIAPKGRVQDGTLEGENFKKLSIADDLLAQGKESIPFLINKLDDEAKMDRGVIDFWYKVYVSDVALIILNDFFTKNDGITSTIPGFGWDDFLERGNDKDSMGEQVLRNYIKKHGRSKIKERWQKFWDENKKNIVWDETEKCFKLNAAKI